MKQRVQPRHQDPEGLLPPAIRVPSSAEHRGRRLGQGTSTTQEPVPTTAGPEKGGLEARARGRVPVCPLTMRREGKGTSLRREGSELVDRQSSEAEGQGVLSWVREGQAWREATSGHSCPLESPPLCAENHLVKLVFPSLAQRPLTPHYVDTIPSSHQGNSDLLRLSLQPACGVKAI